MLPDAKRMVIDWLLADTTLRTLVSTRVYSKIPKKGGDDRFPLVRVTRIPSPPAMSRPLYIDRPHMQIDVFGGSETTTWDIAAQVMERLAAMPGNHHSTDGVVTAVKFTNVGDTPDDEFSPAKPRQRIDAVLTTHAAQLQPT